MYTTFEIKLPHLIGQLLTLVRAVLINVLFIQPLNRYVKSWLNTLKDKVAKCTCQIMVEYA